ncbi:helix-turn-helix domain-containing protein [Streptomyces sp. XM4011]|uniref:helix-turn-helix domain-containing protein n=1 Tax=Streptomyces TaxID=1883 RepID=UPI001FF97CC6|nr:helix-turn-helix transcriptional regulator [Streptomyces sp. XM4011]MCK1814271.1 helix-turn-helix domain-containing protein [Streptomyces sp. XM4011]
MAGFDEGKGRTVSTSVNTSALAIQRDVGAELRRLRLEAGFATQTAAAKQLKCSQNKISYVESGKRWPDDALLKRMLKVYGVEEPKRTEILTTIRTGKSIDRSWWQEPKYRSLITGRFGRIFPLEDAAETMWVHSGTYVPGLLQTRDYIEALAAFGQKDESALHRELFVETRLRRQQILTRSQPVTMHALFLESALWPRVGGPEVMKGQLRHLRDMAARENITLRTVPFSAGAAATLGAPFNVFEFSGAHNKTIVMHELSRGDDEMDDPADVRRMRRRFNDLAEAALSTAETVDLIEEIEKML